MKVVQFDEGEKRTQPDIRGNLKDGRHLLTGDENSPDNYRLNFSRQTTAVFSPRHKHNFEQIRMVLGGGSMNYGPNQEIEPGEVVYFPEGTPYGPQEGYSEQYSVVLQFGGPSGQGYVSRKRMSQAKDALKQSGSFEGGVFRRSGALAPGQKRNQDAYEAVWEHVNGRKLIYPGQRYAEPVHIKPDHFRALELPDQPGVLVRRLGSFSERSVDIAILDIAAAQAYKLAPRAGRQIGFVMEGEGQIEQFALRPHTALELSGGEGATIKAATALKLLLVGLPIFTAAEAAAYKASLNSRPGFNSAA
jgi:mannose-6-phosphate isomerase-like protein (cupin superfamily)